MSKLEGIPKLSIRFSSKDVVRHPLVGRIVEAYEGPAMTLDIILDAIRSGRNTSGTSLLVPLPPLQSPKVPSPTCRRTARVEISVRLGSDEEVGFSMLNGGQAGDHVLSFPMAEGPELAAAGDAGPELMLGDLILAHGVSLAKPRTRTFRSIVTRRI